MICSVNHIYLLWCCSISLLDCEDDAENAETGSEQVNGDAENVNSDAQKENNDAGIVKSDAEKGNDAGNVNGDTGSVVSATGDDGKGMFFHCCYVLL